LEYKLEHYRLRDGHSYHVRRPRCIKAINNCPSKGVDNVMVIDCDKAEKGNGKLEKDDRVYIEITKRKERPDTCKDERNQHCCRYVNANLRGGICELYQRRRNGNDNSYENKKDNNNSDPHQLKSEDEEFSIRADLKQIEEKEEKVNQQQQEEEHKPEEKKRRNKKSSSSY